MVNKNGKKIKNSLKLKITLFVILTIFTFGLITYGAFFVVKHQEDNNIISSGCFSTNFVDSSSINLSNAISMSDEEGLKTDPYSFTLTNTCNLTSIYYVIISTKTGSFSNDFINVSYNNSNPTMLSSNLTNDIYPIDSGYSSSYIITNGILENGESITYDIRLWINEDATYTPGMNWEGEIKVVSTVAEHDTALLAKSDYAPDFGTDTSGANTPNIVTNLIPVVYDEDSGEWIKASTTQSGWYNYDEQIWANAVTTTADTRALYNASDPGTIIPMDDILGMYVWIPRYEYNYTNLGTSYAGGTASLPGGIDIKFVSDTSTTEDTNYIIHPAFRDGSKTYTNNAYTTTTAYQMGGWDKEITGFWYAKFETTGTASEPTSKPNLSSLRIQNVSEMFSTIQKVSSYQGINLDSHLSKNSEWGAVAYLSQSTYGKYGNPNYEGANKEIYINNSRDYYTGKSMGMPAGATGYNSSSAGSYEYNEEYGIGAATTGNIYGIYDMVGGAYEYVMGNYSNTTGLSGFSSLPNNKYYDNYTTTTNTTACGGIICFGHALSETAGWYSDYKGMISSTSPWFLRGANSVNCNYSYSGVFVSDNDSGYSNTNYGSRASLV